jgi:hypothetical protein
MLTAVPSYAGYYRFVDEFLVGTAAENPDLWGFRGDAKTQLTVTFRGPGRASQSARQRCRGKRGLGTIKRRETTAPRSWRPAEEAANHPPPVQFRLRHVFHDAVVAAAAAGSGCGAVQMRWGAWGSTPRPADYEETGPIGIGAGKEPSLSISAGQLGPTRISEDGPGPTRTGRVFSQCSHLKAGSWVADLG